MNQSLSSLNSVVSAVSNSLYNAAKVNTVDNFNQTEVLRGRIFDTIENMFAQNDINHVGNEWQQLREEAVEHLRNDVCSTEYSNWNKVLNSNDSKALWMKINWKGTFSHGDLSQKPDIDELERHFA